MKHYLILDIVIARVIAINYSPGMETCENLNQWKYDNKLPVLKTFPKAPIYRC